MQTPQEEAMYSNCFAGSCKRSISTVQVSGSFIQSVRHLPDDNQR